MAVSEDYLKEERVPPQGRTRGLPPQTQYPLTVDISDFAQIQAVCVIERWWQSVKDKRVFTALKHAICASEYSLTQEILRKISPAEAGLLGDPAIEAKLKFRFGGADFPPHILFKIFMSMNAKIEGGTGGVKYISGRRMIRPASEAAADARRQMGNRKYYDQMLEDACEHQQMKITDEADVTSMKDYMQYVSSVDERPAYLGGKENTWRQLNLKVLPRYSCLRSLVGFLDKSRASGRSVALRQLESYTRPSTQQPGSPTYQHRPSTQQHGSPTYQHRPSTHPQIPSPQHEYIDAHHRKSHSSHGSDGRARRRQAKKRADQMKKVYSEGVGVEEGEEEEEEGKDWDQGVDDMYQWTQELSFDDIR